MTLNTSIRYQNSQLHIDDVPVSEIIKETDTPVYIYSMKRALENYQRIQSAFTDFDAHIHYSAKANGNLTILRTLVAAGAGVDCVSAGEIHRALQAGAKPEHIVFAGVGKTQDEIRYAIDKGVGWFNVENVMELQYINDAADASGVDSVQVALRLNPEVTASTHPYIATGHGGAKFGLTADVIQKTLTSQADYPRLNFAGVHIHIGSQLGEISATRSAAEKVVELITPYPEIRTINIGGGMPARYDADSNLPVFDDFAKTLHPVLKDYQVLLEPGRSIIADAGILLTKILYIKAQAGQKMYIVDASMTELMRPMLYQAKHEIVPVIENTHAKQTVQVVGPVCETTDIIAKNIDLPQLQAGDTLAILTAGAYGMVMASNYNARPRPAGIVVNVAGDGWQIARKRETWDDLLRAEQI